MAVDRITASQYADQIKNAIQVRNTSYDVDLGPIPDLIINPISVVLERQNADINKVQSLLLLLNNGDYTHADLVAFVANEGIKPDIGARATVTLTFSTPRVDADMTVTAGFPVSTLVDEALGVALTFVTLTTVTLPVASKSSYYNALTKRYEITVLARCTTLGSIGNVAIDRITKPLRSLVGFSYVTNAVAATGGRDATTDIDLIERYLIAISGTDSSTVDGIESTADDLFSNIYDALVVYGDDPLLVRASEDAGAVDMWVIGSQNVTVTDVAPFVGLYQPIVLANQPVVDVVSVMVGATPYTKGVDYDFVTDDGGNGRSIRGVDSVVFKNPNKQPIVGQGVNIVYTYNSLISQIQTRMQASDVYVPARDLLVRAAVQVDMEISGNLVVRPGYNSGTILSLVNDAISQFINALMLNARIAGSGDYGSVQMSDVNAVARRITGVDNLVFTKFGPVGTLTAADMPVGKNQYPRIASGKLSLTIA